MAVATVYDGGAAAWDSGAGTIYRPLAENLIAASPMPLTGRLLLDAGSGTGAVAFAAAAVGARVVAADQSHEMIVVQRAHGWPAAVADVRALPFHDGAFDGVVAGFVVNHLPPAPTLAELARTVTPGGLVLASTWAARVPDPVKAAVRGVLTAWGWVPPAWYLTMKSELEPLSSDPEHFAAAAGEAGLVEISATLRRPDLGVRDPGAVVAYRFALPHIAPWLAGMDSQARSALADEAVRAVAPHVGHWRPAMVVLAARVGGQLRTRPAQRSSASR